MAFPPQFLDEIRARVPLSGLVGRKVRLTRAGREWKSPCPFHKEKTPSFYVNDQKGFFHCFGCGAHGDAVGFVMRHDNLSFVEAVEALATEAGLEMPQQSEAERTRYAAEKTQHEILESVTSWFEAQLRGPAGRRALAYLHDRGLNDDAINAFRLGYAPADAQALRAAMLERGATEAMLIELGLIRQAEDGSRTYAFFRDRAIFPVTDRRGRPIAFGARLLEGEGPKYINSPEHTLFHKGETLYGIARARLAAADDQPVIVAEGYMDVIALALAGFQGAVAPMGTALTEPQLETLWRLIPAGVRAPILCLDGDNAGQNAARRAVARVLPLLKPDHTLRIAFLPRGEDPDSLLRRGGKAELEAVLAAAIPLSEMLWRETLAERPGRTPEEQAGFRALLMDRVSQILDRSVQVEYRADMNRRLREASAARFVPYGKPGERRRPKGAFYTGPRPIARPAGANHAAASHARARVLLAAMLRHPFLYGEHGETFALLAMPSDLAALHRAICDLLDEGAPAHGETLQARLADSGHGDAIAALLHPNVALHAAFARPEAEESLVRAGFASVIAGNERIALLADIEAASRHFADRFDEASLARLRRLQSQMAAPESGIPEAFSEE